MMLAYSMSRLIGAAMSEVLGAHSGPASPPLQPHRIPRWEIYLAAGLGGFCLAFAGQLHQVAGSTTARLGEFLGVMVSRGASDPQIIVAVLLATAALACAAAWLHEPTTRFDAFSRGLAVFAVLSITSPQPHSEADAAAGPVEVRSGPAEAAVSDPRANEGSVPPRRSWLDLLLAPAWAQTYDHGEPSAKAVIWFELPADAEPGSSLVTVRDPASAQILARQHLDPSGAVTLSAPPGDYVVEVEGAGLQRSRAQVTVKEDAQFAFPVQSSRVPVGLQYLLPQQEVMATEIE
jgi:hypothetical protein